jgi:hydroxymethylglutaryl-CoA lyase
MTAEGGRMDVVVRDVSMRDGLQDAAPIPSEQKVALFDALRHAGLTEVELTSFVRADRIPALADAEVVCRATAVVDDPPIVRWGLVLNRRGAERALEAGLRHLVFVLSVSEEHNEENAGASVERSLALAGEVAELGRTRGAQVEVTLATAFGCPFVGPVPVDDVVRVAEAALALPISGVNLADTIGTAVPTEVAALARRVTALDLSRSVGLHLHDTRGTALANTLAAIEAGISRFDAAVGGLGGCPFAPGASGNLPTEDLVHALEAMGVSTGVDLDALLVASELACSFVGRPMTSHVGVAGPRFATRHDRRPA